MRKIFKLIRDKHGDYTVKDNFLQFLCADVLHEYFEFPEKTKTIEIVLSDKSGDYPIRQDSYGAALTTKTGKEYVILVPAIRELIAPLFEKHYQLYVTLFY